MLPSALNEILTSGQMQAVEQAAIGSGAVSGQTLMERAGQGVVEAIFETWPELQTGARRAVVLCGPGNNGGDGFVIARLMHDLGWTVEVVLFGDPGKLPVDAKSNYDRWCAIGPVVLTETDDAKADINFGLRAQVDLKGDPDVYVDAVFGTGLRRPVDTSTMMGSEYLGVLSGTMAGAEMYPHAARVVAVDIPSGLCADSGRVLSERQAKVAPYASLTVTFHRPKLGHVLADGPAFCGTLVVKDIGLAKWRHTVHTANPVHSVDWPSISAGAYPKIGKSADHKFDHGHVLVLSGGFGATGAARLAARASLRIGAGLVTLAVPRDAMAEVASQITALMMRGIADAHALEAILQDVRINALCVGPGMGTGAAQADRIAAVLATGRYTVLDADALTLIAQHSALFDALHAGCVLTPHGGEFARLFPDIAEKLGAPAATGPAFSKVDATRAAAERAGCVVVFKGADTVISDRSGRCSVHAAAYDQAAPWLATAGSGDVLAGFIAGLLARGFSPHQAAEVATILHVKCARSFGPGLIAEDLPEALPNVMRDLSV